MLSKRERYIAVATGAAVTILGLNYFLLDPLLTDREDLGRQHEKLSHELHEDYITLENSRKATHRWEKLRASGEAGLSTDISTSESTLINAMSGWAQDSHLPLISIRPDREGAANQGLHETTFQATVEGPMEAMAQFIYRVETAKMPARIRELDLAAKNENSDHLQMQIRISTLWEDPHGGGSGDTGGSGGSQSPQSDGSEP